MAQPGTNLPDVRLEGTSPAWRRVAASTVLPLRPFIWLLGLLDRTPVEQSAACFSEDGEFEQRFKVFGDPLEARQLFDAEIRRALVAHTWTGTLVTSGDTVAWRRKGFLFPARADRFLADAEVFRTLFRR